MANIKVISDRPLYDGVAITFRAPCECNAVEGLTVSYLNTDMVFAFWDCHGNDLTTLGNLFEEGAYVKAILDTKNGRAYLQNADTNAYLEGRFDGLFGKNNTVLSESSVAFGEGNTVGLLGYYWSNIDFSTKTLTLSTEQGIPSTGQGGDNGDGIEVTWQPGDVVSIVNNTKYEYCAKVVSIVGNKITLDSLPFGAVAQMDPAKLSFDDFSIAVYDKPTEGIVDLGKQTAAIGLGNTASNWCAVAVGRDNVVQGQYGFAAGRGNTNKAYAGYSEGLYNTQENTALYSHVEGLQNTVSGKVSHAEGASNQANGDYSHVEGYLVQADGWAAHAEGAGYKDEKEVVHPNIASGYASHVEGGAYVNKTDGTVTKNQATGDYSHVEGAGNEASGFYSHVEGIKNKASGNASHAEGNNTEAAEEGSHSEGTSTKATGKCSHAEGNTTVASAYASHAEGSETEASGQHSHVEGWKNIASGQNSHAEGYANKASGWAAHVDGIGNLAEHQGSSVHGFHNNSARNYQHVVGEWNKADASALFQVGNGTAEEKRSSCFAVKEDGTTTLYGKRMTNVGTPTNATDAATKGYVDKPERIFKQAWQADLNLEKYQQEGYYLAIHAKNGPVNYTGTADSNCHGYVEIARYNGSNFVIKAGDAFYNDSTDGSDLIVQTFTMWNGSAKYRRYSGVSDSSKTGGRKWSAWKNYDTDTDTNTTYSLSQSGRNITLTGSDGSIKTVTVADTNTTYSLSSTGNTVVLTGSDGGKSTAYLPDAVKTMGAYPLNSENPATQYVDKGLFGTPKSYIVYIYGYGDSGHPLVTSVVVPNFNNLTGNTLWFHYRLADENYTGSLLTYQDGYLNVTFNDTDTTFTSDIHAILGVQGIF